MLPNSYTIKLQLYELCSAYVNERIKAAEQAIASARQAAAEDTKSSAGDKYETGRAMMQQETDRNSIQLHEARKLKAALNGIKVSARTVNKAEPGSLAITDNGNFYIAISAGSFTIGRDVYYAISSASPIGFKMMGLSGGDSFELNYKKYTIQAVY